MNKFLSFGPMLDGYVVYDQYNNFYNQDLAIATFGGSLNAYTLKGAISIFHELSYVHGVPCKIAKVSLKYGYLLGSFLKITKRNDILTRHGLLNVNVNDIILKNLIDNEEIMFNFFVELYEKGFECIMNVTGDVTSLKKCMNNINADPSALLFSKSWVSGPRDLISALHLMAKESESIYDIKKTKNTIDEIKELIIQDLASNPSGNINNDPNENIHVEYRTGYNDHFIVYDNGKTYNENLDLRKVVSGVDIETAINIYTRLREKGNVSCKLGYVRPAVKYQLYTINDLDASSKERLPDDLIYNVALDAILSYFDISKQTYDMAISNNYGKILILKPTHRTHFLKSVLKDAVKNMKCKKLFYDDGTVCGPENTINELLNKVKDTCKIYGIANIKKYTDNLVNEIKKN